MSITSGYPYPAGSLTSTTKSIRSAGPGPPPPQPPPPPPPVPEPVPPGVVKADSKKGSKNLKGSYKGSWVPSVVGQPRDGDPNNNGIPPPPGYNPNPGPIGFGPYGGMRFKKITCIRTVRNPCLCSNQCCVPCKTCCYAPCSAPVGQTITIVNPNESVQRRYINGELLGPAQNRDPDYDRRRNSYEQSRFLEDHQRYNNGPRRDSRDMDFKRDPRYDNGPRRDSRNMDFQRDPRYDNGPRRDSRNMDPQRDPRYDNGPRRDPRDLEAQRRNSRDPNERRRDSQVMNGQRRDSKVVDGPRRDSDQRRDSNQINRDRMDSLDKGQRANVGNVPGPSELEERDRRRRREMEDRTRERRELEDRNWGRREAEDRDRRRRESEDRDRYYRERDYARNRGGRDPPNRDEPGIGVKSNLTIQSVRDKELRELEDMKRDRDRTELIARYFASLEGEKAGRSRPELKYKSGSENFVRDEVDLEDARTRMRAEDAQQRSNAKVDELCAAEGEDAKPLPEKRQISRKNSKEFEEPKSVIEIPKNASGTEVVVDDKTELGNMFEGLRSGESEPPITSKQPSEDKPDKKPSANSDKDIQLQPSKPGIIQPTKSENW